MKVKLKESFRNTLKKIFIYVEKNKYFQWIRGLPLIVRIIIFIILTIWSFFAILTPIPAGWITEIFAFAILFGIKPVKKYTIRGIYFLRLHILWNKYKIWRHNRKK